MIHDGFNPFAAIRFHVPETFKDTLTKYTVTAASLGDESIFNRQMDCFLFSAAIGAREETWIDNDKLSDGLHGFADGNVLKLPEVEFLYLIALQKDESNYEVIQDPSRIVKIAEGYAAHGIRRLDEMIGKGSLDPVSNLSRGIKKLLKG